MPKINESSYFNDSFVVSNPKLRSWFGKVVAGQHEVYDTPFAKGESTEQLLSAWKAILVSINTRWPSLWAFENDLASKVGPMSIQKPLSERMDDIDHYYDDVLLSSKALRDTATAAVLKEFSSIRGLEVRKELRTIELMKKSTNSGSPFYTKRRDVTSETAPCKVHWYRDEVIQELNGHVWRAAAILGWRGQEGGPDDDDVKQRVVWMFPYAINISELRVYQPLIEAAQRFNLVPAWVSMDVVDRRITDLFDTKSDSDLIVCTDFSKFDQHFNSKLQEAALLMLTGILSPGVTSRKWLDEVFPIKYMIPLAYDWECVRFGKHGMGSGSGGTNCDETLVHRALQYEAAQIRGAKLNPNSQCLGDDGILTYPGITVKDVVEAYTSHGLEMNEDKQYASTQDCTYLRRWHHKDYRIDGVCAGVYSTCRALGRMRYLERWMDPKKGWDARAVALRQLSIIENCKWHPLREKFVEFCMKRDKYRLGVDIPGFLANIQTEAQKKIDLMPDFLGYTKTLQSQGSPLGGIQDWWVVKYLKSK